jgi:hypothetical protein
MQSKFLNLLKGIETPSPLFVRKRPNISTCCQALTPIHYPPQSFDDISPPNSGYRGIALMALIKPAKYPDYELGPFWLGPAPMPSAHYETQ